METGFNYYRIKMAWLAASEDGSLTPTKTEDLVYASSYTEAEKIAYLLIQEQCRNQYGDVAFEIVKTKISQMLYNSSLLQDPTLISGMTYNYVDKKSAESAGIYAVKVMLISLDETTAKKKRNYETYYVSALSNSDAAKSVTEHLKMHEFVIRDIKFDKAESVIWPVAVFNSISKMAQ